MNAYICIHIYIYIYIYIIYKYTYVESYKNIYMFAYLAICLYRWIYR